MELLRLTDADRGLLHRLTGSLDRLAEAVERSAEARERALDEIRSRSEEPWAPSEDDGWDRPMDVDVEVVRTSARSLVVRVEGVLSAEEAKASALAAAGDMDFADGKELDPEYEVSGFSWKGGSENEEEEMEKGQRH